MSHVSTQSFVLTWSESKGKTIHLLKQGAKPVKQKLKRRKYDALEPTLVDKKEESKEPSC